MSGTGGFILKATGWAAAALWIKRGCVVIGAGIGAVLLWVIIGSLVIAAHYPSVSDPSSIPAASGFYGEEGEVTNDRVMLVEHNWDALIHRLRLIEGAKERIILSTFDFHDDDSGQDVMAALVAAAERGVEIQIITDGLTGLLRMGGNDHFAALDSYENVEIRLYNPLNILDVEGLHCRLHDKYLIVDGTYCLLGGRNTYNYFLGDYGSEHENFDREVLSVCTGGESGTIAQVEAYFDRIWSEDCTKPLSEKADEKAEKGAVQAAKVGLLARYKGLRERFPEAYQDFDYIAASCEARKITLIAGSTAPEEKEPMVLETLTRLMEGAQERVVLHTPYAVCDSYMLDCLRRVKESCPDFTLQVNNVLSGGNLPASSDYLWHRDDLLETGVNLLEYDGGKSYHCKTILIDEDISVIGSFNYDMRSVYLDTELMLVIDSEPFNDVLEAEMLAAQEEALTIPAGAGNLSMLSGEASVGKKIALILLGLLSPVIRRVI